jgi:hypothetical protein
MKLAIMLLAGVACLMPMVAGAQNGPGCSGRCATQFGVCEAAAEAVLEECLDRATTARDKAVCAAAFVKLEDACRTTEAACLSNCPS